MKPWTLYNLFVPKISQTKHRKLNLFQIYYLILLSYIKIYIEGTFPRAQPHRRFYDVAYSYFGWGIRIVVELQSTIFLTTNWLLIPNIFRTFQRAAAGKIHTWSKNIRIHSLNNMQRRGFIYLFFFLMRISNLEYVCTFYYLTWIYVILQCKVFERLKR